jgi:hypothetical protein
VIGSSQHSRWQQLIGGGSKVARILREAGALGIDVHVIALRKPSATDPPAPPPAATLPSAAPDQRPAASPGLAP